MRCASGAAITLHDLIYLMISISDNLATDVLIGKAGVEAVNRTMADLGMKNSLLTGTITRLLRRGTGTGPGDTERLCGCHRGDPER